MHRRVAEEGSCFADGHWKRSRYLSLLKRIAHVFDWLVATLCKEYEPRGCFFFELAASSF